MEGLARKRANETFATWIRECDKEKDLRSVSWYVSGRSVSTPPLTAVQRDGTWRYAPDAEAAEYYTQQRAVKWKVG